MFSSCWPFKLNKVLAVSKIQSLILLPSNRVKHPLGSALLSQITSFLFRFYSVLVSPSFDTVLMQLCKPKAHFRICITLMCSAIIELEYWKKINISIFSSDEDFHFPFAEQFSQSLNFRQNSPAVD